MTLVPWRPGHPERERLWAVVRPHLEALGYPLHLGDSAGSWARSAAVNAASVAAGSWDVAVIADADTIPTASAVRAAVIAARRTRGAARPHDRLYVLNPGQTRMILLRGWEALRLAEHQRTRPGGGLLVVSRPAWEEVGGYDERYIGWGHEDSAMNTILLARASWQVVAGEAYHLHHSFDRPPTRHENHDRMRSLQEQYRREIDRASRQAGRDLREIL